MTSIYIPSPVKNCQHCGKAMTRPPRFPLVHWEKRKWCGKACMDAARKPAERTCQRCGKVYRPKVNRKRGHQYCSIPCANIGKPIKGPYRKMRDGQKVRAVHRVVKEREIGRPLEPWEVVHHRDHQKQNNDPANLGLMTNSSHSRMHMKGNGNARRSRSGG